VLAAAWWRGGGTACIFRPSVCAAVSNMSSSPHVQAQEADVHLLIRRGDFRGALKVRPANGSATAHSLFH